MRRLSLILLLLVAAGVAAVDLVYRPGTAVRVATGLVSHTLCSETFVAGLDPDRTFAETLRTMPGIRRLAPWLRYQVDRTRREVRTTLGGHFERRAAYHEGVGCSLVYPGSLAAVAPSIPPGAGAARGHHQGGVRGQEGAGQAEGGLSPSPRAEGAGPRRRRRRRRRLLRRP